MKSYRTVLLTLLALAGLLSAGRSLPARRAAAAPTVNLPAAAVSRAAGNERIKFTDGATIPTNYPAAFLAKLSGAQPTTLAAADFDRDGVPDVVSGYAQDKGGALALHRGNELSIFPAGRDARGEEIPAFLSDARVFDLNARPDFIVTGDFDNDTLLDVVTAQRGAASLQLSKGDGEGNFAPAQSQTLSGAVTAVAAGDVNRTDGLADLVVAIDGADGPQLLVMEGLNGAWREPQTETVALPHAAGDIALASLSADGFLDVAVAAGNELIVVPGRDRKLARTARNNVAPLTALRHAFDAPVKALAPARLANGGGQQIAVVTADGALQMVSEREKGRAGERELVAAPLSAALPAAPAKIMAARVSASGSTDDLILLDGENRSVVILSRAPGAKSLSLSPALTFPATDTPVAALPMRLNKDGLDDLVFLTPNQPAPAVALTAPQAVFTVNSTGLGFDATPGNGVCETAAGNGQCTLQAAIGETNALAGADEIRFNLPAPAPFSIALDFQFLRDITETVTLDATTQPGFNGSPIVEINGAGATVNSRALQFTRSTSGATNAANSVARGLVINRFRNSAIVMGDFNNSTRSVRVEGCYLGTDIAGTAALGNGQASGADNGALEIQSNTHIIGGTTAAARNVISGNNANGIRIGLGGTTTGTTIQGNFIGTDKNGTADLGNAGDGIRSGNVGGENTTVGGTAAGAGNVISGNGGSGISFASSTGLFSGLVIEGNFFGTDLTGNTDLGNDQRGVLINGFDGSNRIGGTTNAARNIISGNGKDGIELRFCESFNVQGNFVGFKADGTTPLTNDRHGVYLTNSTSRTTFGGGTPVVGACNAPCNSVAVGTNGAGVSIRTTNPPDLTESPNAPEGTLFGVDNVILHTIFTKFIAASLGIDLGDDGRTPNDPGDADTGPNNLQNHAIPDECLTSFNANSPLTDFQCTGNLNSSANTDFTIDFYLNSPTGQTVTSSFLGSRNVLTNASGNTTFTFNFSANPPSGASLFAITRRPLTPRDTSEDSPPLQLGGSPCTYQVTPTSFNIPAAGNNGNSVTVVTQAGCPWTAASNAAFITGVNPANGTGSGTASFNVAPNAGAPRTGTLTIAGQTVTVNQGTNCTYTVSPQTVNLSGAEQFSAVNLTTQAGCDWTGASNSPFINSVTPSGVGSSVVNFAVTANGGAPRTGTFTVGGQTVTVNQTNCTLSVSPTSGTAGAQGASDFNLRAFINTESGCPWTISGGGSGFIPIPNGGVSASPVGFSVGPNVSGPRTLIATISNSVVSVAFTIQQSSKNAKFDFDNDNKADRGVIGAAAGGFSAVNSAPSANFDWRIVNSSNGNATATSFGQTGDKIAPGDYHADGRADFAVFRPATATWLISRPTGVPSQNFDEIPFGQANDIPVPNDYDGDGKTDLAMFRPSTNEWLIRRSRDGNTITQTLGASGDIPVPGFYDADEKADLATWRPADATWRILNSSDGSSRAVPFGLSSDKPVPGDYDGDFREDMAVFRPAAGEWRIQQSSDNMLRVVNLGMAGDILAPADFDGDLRTDVAVWRPGTQTWSILRSSDGMQQTVQQGQAGDIPLEAAVLLANSIPTTTTQFSAATYAANEGAKVAAVTVTRAGDTTAASAVNFASQDSFAFADCAAQSATANQRCDYQLARGTLNFAAGETSKTFDVLFHDDFYVETSEAINLALSNPAGATLGPQATATLNIADNDTTAGANRVLVAKLDAAQEVPTNNSTATGNGAVTLNDAETQITVNMTFAGLSSAQTAAHIHGPAHVGVNAPVLFNLGVGPITNMTFNVTPAQVAQLKAGLMYFNVHTANFTGGEIRGQILANPLESAREFVRQQYYDFLSRQPDQAGFDFWTGQIATTCGADLACIRQRRVDVSNAFFFELEFQQTGSYVYRLYRAAFGNNHPASLRNPDTTTSCAGLPPPTFLGSHLPKYEVFAADRARLDATQLAASQLALANDFVTRAEFLAAYPATQTAEQYVDALLGVIQSASGVNLTSQRAALINLHNSNGRGAVLYRLADDNQAGNPINNRAFIDAEYNKAFVATEYFGYLKRDADICGLNFWLNVVNQFPLRSPTGQNGMVCAFITSAEHQQRFSAGVTRANQECP